jgi:hypothetical protein
MTNFPPSQGLNQHQSEGRFTRKTGTRTQKYGGVWVRDGEPSAPTTGSCGRLCVRKTLQPWMALFVIHRDAQSERDLDWLCECTRCRWLRRTWGKPNRSAAQEKKQIWLRDQFVRWCPKQRQKRRADWEIKMHAALGEHSPLINRYSLQRA